MDYAENFTEDKRLTQKYLSKYFPHLKTDEDIISACVIKLWEKRTGYNPAIAKYSTHAFKWIRHVVTEYIRKRYAQKRQFETISIYTEVGDGIALLDTLEADCDSTYKEIEDLVKIVFDKNEKLRPIIAYYMQGYWQKEIAIILGLSKTQVSYLLRKFKKLCRQEYLKSEA